MSIATTRKSFTQHVKSILSSHYFAVATTVITLSMFYPVLSGLGVITR
ncbi:MAG: hypothetical protein Q9M19_06405 [Mariprofundaceae bacterium]|nr:hypothetical protein [Mariprofundaceae bacterium]